MKLAAALSLPLTNGAAARPFAAKITGDEVTIEYEMNVGLGHNQPAPLTGKAR